MIFPSLKDRAAAAFVRRRDGRLSTVGANAMPGSALLGSAEVNIDVL
jgi:hypothetical protein